MTRSIFKHYILYTSWEVRGVPWSSAKHIVVAMYSVQDNRHKLTMVMSPDEAFMAQTQQQEKDKLDQMVSQLLPEQKKDIYDKGRHGALHLLCQTKVGTGHCTFSVRQR